MNTLSDKKFSIVAFDVNETLLDITTLRPLFKKIFNDESMLREWFSQLILYSQTLTLTGKYLPFGDLAVSVLNMVASYKKANLHLSDITELKTLLSNMPAYDDVAPSLKQLKDAGYRLVTLTNTATSSAPSPLEKAGLTEFFERQFSVQQVHKFKPAKEVYQYVARQMAAETSDICLVACHIWDIIGAQDAGCYSGFVMRDNNAELIGENIPRPHFKAQDLYSLSQQIINSAN